MESTRMKDLLLSVSFNKKEPIRHESLHPCSLDAESSESTRTTNIPAKLQTYQTLYTNQLTQSHFFKHVARNSIPSFSKQDLTIGSILGTGGFCVVRELTEIHPLKGITETPLTANAQHGGDDSNDDNDEDDDDDDDDKETRRYMTENAYRSGKARYAIKRLRTDLSLTEDGASHYRGMLDLALEAEFLSHMHHPNIIRMRGKMACTNPVWTEGYFLVLDRLYGTLEEVIEGRWKEEVKAHSKFFGMRKKDKEQIRQLFQERLIVAYDIASVFRYLHENRIMYRDIKSENIGFDVRGDVKVFDFGLAKELPCYTVKKPNPKKTYKLTPRTGSIPYIAPEVMELKPYNHKADVFSFAMLLWEILSLKKPFEGFNTYDYKEKVCKGGYRPSCGKWPTLTKALIKECWENDLLLRPEFDRIASTLRGELNDITEGLNSTVRDRTAHLMNRSNASRHTRNGNLSASTRVRDLQTSIRNRLLR